MILGKDPIQGLEHTLHAEKIYLINFTERNKKFCLILHYDWANSYLFIHKFKAEDSDIAASPLCFGNITKDWTVDNIKKLD